jgi:hypothetical protein
MRTGWLALIALSAVVSGFAFTNAQAEEQPRYLISAVLDPTVGWTQLWILDEANHTLRVCQRARGQNNITCTETIDLKNPPIVK